LLDQYDGMDNPCGLGQSFEKAVWWAMSRCDVALMKDRTRDEPFEDVVRRIVHEELRNMLITTLNIEAQEAADAGTA